MRLFREKASCWRLPVKEYRIGSNPYAIVADLHQIIKFKHPGTGFLPASLGVIVNGCLWQAATGSHRTPAGAWDDGEIGGEGLTKPGTGGSLQLVVNRNFGFLHRQRFQ